MLSLSFHFYGSSVYFYRIAVKLKTSWCVVKWVSKELMKVTMRTKVTGCHNKCKFLRSYLHAVEIQTGIQKTMSEVLERVADSGLNKVFTTMMMIIDPSMRV